VTFFTSFIHQTANKHCMLLSASYQKTPQKIVLKQDIMNTN